MSTPAKTKGENVKNTRQSTTKASASRSESEDSDESSSSSDEDSGRNTRRAQVSMKSLVDLLRTIVECLRTGIHQF